MFLSVTDEPEHGAASTLSRIYSFASISASQAGPNPTFYLVAIFLVYTGFVRRRWVFSISLLPSSRLSGLPAGVRRTAERAFCGLFQLVFPDDCRDCSEPLTNISRIPVCQRCLKDPQPLTAEFYCSDCRMPFVNAFPLDRDGRCALCRLGHSGFDAAYTYGS